MSRFLDGGVVRHFSQLKRFLEIRRVLENHADTSIVCLKELFQRKTSDELMLGELLGTLQMAICRERLFGGCVSDTRYCLR